MNYADIEKGIAGLGEKAKKNELSMEDMDGGTFTISNGGVFGSLFGTPIINPPQSAILGMHGTFERPVVRNGHAPTYKTIARSSKHTLRTQLEDTPKWGPREAFQEASQEPQGGSPGCRSRPLDTQGNHPSWRYRCPQRVQPARKHTPPRREKLTNPPFSGILDRPCRDFGTPGSCKITQESNFSHARRKPRLYIRILIMGSE